MCLYIIFFIVLFGPTMFCYFKVYFRFFAETDYVNRDKVRDKKNKYFNTKTNNLIQLLFPYISNIEAFYPKSNCLLEPHKTSNRAFICMYFMGYHYLVITEMKFVRYELYSSLFNAFFLHK